MNFARAATSSGISTIVFIRAQIGRNPMQAQTASTNATNLSKVVGSRRDRFGFTATE
jgi:hypothetical protein